MSNTMLNFKYGKYKNLPTSKIPGTVYVTTDEQAMYVDLPKANSTELARVRIGDIIVKESARTAEPPFCEDAFYYFIEENALLRWGTQEGGVKGWKQINSVSDVTADLSDVKSKVATIEGNIDQLGADLAAEVKRSEDVDADHEARIAAIESDYATGSTVSTAVNEINEKIGKTNEAVAAAQSKADSAYGLAEEAKADAEAAQGAVETVQGAAEAAQSTADNAQSTADSALATAGAAQGTADSALANASNAQSKADEAYNLAEQAKADAEAAQGTADSALANAGNAQATANSALSAASNAQSTADSALANAGNAQSAAENAQSRADEAYNLADEAKADAGNAQNAADEAQDTADNALAAANEKLPLAGGTLQGNLNMNNLYQINKLADPTSDQDAATKKYVDAISTDLQGKIDQVNADALLIDGTNEMTADLNMGSTELDSHRIINLATPTDAKDAATKKYVDDEIANKIKLIDAMTYKGVVSQSSTAIHTTEPHTATAQKGDVWKVGAPGMYVWNSITETGIAAKAGDLLIYNGEDDSNNIEAWEHVSSGYEDDYLQKFMLQSIDQGVALHLSNGLGEDIPEDSSVSKIHFVTPQTSGLKIESVVVEGIPTIKASFIWQSFDPVTEPEL